MAGKPWVAYYTTWEGFTVKIETAKFGEEYWGRFSAAIDDSVTDVAKRNSAVQTVREINGRTAGWTYMLTAGIQKS